MTTSFSSPLIEKGLVADPDVAGDVVACEAVAQFLLGEHNCVLDTLELSTPRDDLLGPGQTIHLHSPRLGITDADQHYWLQHLEVTVDERGVFTQRLVCLRQILSMANGDPPERLSGPLAQHVAQRLPQGGAGGRGPHRGAAARPRLPLPPHPWGSPGRWRTTSM